MARFSRFAPLGLMRFDRRKPDAAAIYDAIKASWGDQVSFEDGSYQDGTASAQALGMARVRRRLRAAAEQRLPSRVSCLLPVRERELGIIPGYQDTVAQRRAVLATRYQIAMGGTELRIEDALRTVLGDDFIAYRPTPLAEAVNYPASINGDVMNLAAPTVPRKVLRLLDTITAYGAQQVEYELVATPSDATDATTAGPVAGEKLVIDAGATGVQETVTISAVLTNPDRVELDCNRGHNPGVLAFTHPYPSWASTKRHNLVVLTASAAADPEKRRKVHELLSRMCRASSVWNITDGVAGTTLGPFQVGVGKLGITTIGAVAL